MNLGDEGTTEELGGHQRRTVQEGSSHSHPLVQVQRGLARPRQCWYAPPAPSLATPPLAEEPLAVPVLCSAVQGDQEEIRKAQKMFDEVHAALQDAESKKEEATASLHAAKEREEELKAAKIELEAALNELKVTWPSLGQGHSRELTCVLPSRPKRTHTTIRPKSSREGAKREAWCRKIRPRTNLLNT